MGGGLGRHVNKELLQCYKCSNWSTTDWDVGHKGMLTELGAILYFAPVNCCRIISRCEYLKGDMETCLGGSLCGSQPNNQIMKTLWVLLEDIFLTLLASAKDYQNDDDGEGGKLTRVLPLLLISSFPSPTFWFPN